MLGHGAVPWLLGCRRTNQPPDRIPHLCCARQEAKRCSIELAPVRVAECQPLPRTTSPSWLYEMAMPMLQSRGGSKQDGKTLAVQCA